MRVSELQQKEIISLQDGRSLGRIVDIEMDEKGQILSFYVDKKSWFRLFRKDSSITIQLSQIKKIGEDVILVEISE